MFEDKFAVCTFLQSSLKVFNKLCTVIKENIVCIEILKNDFVTEGKVTNPKLLDVTCRVCQKVKRYIEKYLVHIKYWQILGY